MLPIHQQRIQQTLHTLGKIQPEELAPILASYYTSRSFPIANQELRQLADVVSSMAVAISGFVMEASWQQQVTADIQQQREATRLATGPEGEILLTVQQVAERLGVGKQKVYRMITRGILPAINLNAGTGQRSHLRVNAADLP